MRYWLHLLFCVAISAIFARVAYLVAKHEGLDVDGNPMLKIAVLLVGAVIGYAAACELDRDSRW